MYPLYEDLREKLGDPLWVDEHGVPRYQPFAPDMLDIYAKFGALLEIRCQACHRPFQVGVSWSIIKCIGSGELVHWNEEGHDGRPMVMPSVEEGVGAFGFGDAPWHETPDEGVCVGATMSTEAVRVLEFWERPDQPKGENFTEWVRHPEYEVTFALPEE